MDDDSHLEIILLAEDEALAARLEALSDDAFVHESSGFNGMDSLAVVFTTLSIPVLNMIGKIVIEQIQARKHVKLRYGKVTIEGVSEGKVVELLDRLRDDAAK